MAGAQVQLYKLIRNIWPKDAFTEQVLSGSRLLKEFPKDDSFGEKIRFVTVGTAPPQGLGDFANAKLYKAPSTAEEFQVQLASYFGLFSIQGDLYRRAKFTGNKALLREPMERESKGIVNQAKNDFSSFVHGNGGGALGQILSTSTLASQTIQLTNTVDKRRLIKGMNLWASTTDGTTGTPLTGNATITSIATSAAGVVSVTISQSSWAAAFPGLTTSSFLFRAGAFGTGTVFLGMDAWCPLWDSTSLPSAFLGVTRANAPEQLAGISLTLTNKTPRQRIILAAQAQADTGQAGGNLAYVMNTTPWTDLLFELTSANMLQMTKSSGDKITRVSQGAEYDSIQIIGAGGPITIIADPWAPLKVERLIDLDTWQMASCGNWFHWDDEATPDGPMLEDQADSREIRAVGDQQLICKNPWANVRVKTG